MQVWVGQALSDLNREAELKITSRLPSAERPVLARLLMQHNEDVFTRDSSFREASYDLAVKRPLCIDRPAGKSHNFYDAVLGPPAVRYVEVVRRVLNKPLIAIMIRNLKGRDQRLMNAVHELALALG